MQWRLNPFEGFTLSSAFPFIPLILHVVLLVPHSENEQVLLNPGRWNTTFTSTGWTNSRAWCTHITHFRFSLTRMETIQCIWMDAVGPTTCKTTLACHFIYAQAFSYMPRIRLGALLDHTQNNRSSSTCLMLPC